MLAAVLATTAIAALSAFVPVTPIEPYLAGLAATTAYHPVPLGIAAAVGQTSGKLVIFLGARGALRSARWQRWSSKASRRLAGSRFALRPVVAAGRRLTGLLDRPLLTAPIVVVSAATGVPPLLATSVYVARTQISVLVFTLACLVGRSVRFVAIAAAPLLVAHG